MLEEFYDIKKEIRNKSSDIKQYFLKCRKNTENKNTVRGLKMEE